MSVPRRATETTIRKLVEDIPSTVDLTPFIDAAASLTDKVESNDTDNALTELDLVNIANNLAGYFYTVTDPIYIKKKTDDASGEFLERSLYNNAELIDETGYLTRRRLSAVNGKRRVQFAWAGTIPD